MTGCIERAELLVATRDAATPAGRSPAPAAAAGSSAPGSPGRLHGPPRAEPAPRHVAWPALLAVAALALCVAPRARAQAWDAVVPLPASPLSRAGLVGSQPVVRHGSGDFVLVVADGVLRIGPDGRARWHQPAPGVVDVATAGDGTVFALRSEGGPRPSLVLVRYEADGTLAWERSLPGRHDGLSTPHLTGASDEGAFVCSAVSRGGSYAPTLARFDRSGRARWTRALGAQGSCHALASAPGGEVVWGGGRATEDRSAWRTVVERLDAQGRPRWARQFDGHPLLSEVALSPSGDVLVAGVANEPDDIVPGPGVHRLTGSHHRSFAARLDPAGNPRWVWASDVDLRLGAVLDRAGDTLVVGDGHMVRVTPAGTVAEHRVFGFPVTDGAPDTPFVSVMGASLDAEGRVVLVGGLPEPEAIGHRPYVLWEGATYQGPRGAVLARPGW